MHAYYVEMQIIVIVDADAVVWTNIFREESDYEHWIHHPEMTKREK